MDGLAIFIASAMAISLSGVVSPGPMTVAAIERGTRSPLSGLYISIGHGIVEVPLIALIYLGASKLFENDGARMTIGLLGGLYLLYMGHGMLRPGEQAERAQAGPARGASSSIAAGAVLSALNPYFLLWWATVGLGLVIGAEKFGVLGVAVFIVAHWLCDLVWFTFLGALSYRGAKNFGGGVLRTVNLLCGAVLVFFGGFFIYNALRLAAGA